MHVVYNWGHGVGHDKERDCTADNNDKGGPSGLEGREVVLRSDKDGGEDPEKETGQLHRGDEDSLAAASVVDEETLWIAWEEESEFVIKLLVMV